MLKKQNKFKYENDLKIYNYLKKSILSRAPEDSLWNGRLIELLSKVLPVIFKFQREKIINNDIQSIIYWMSLDNLVKLLHYYENEIENINLKYYLETLPGFDTDNLPNINEISLDNHGYCVMQFKYLLKKIKNDYFL